MNCKSILILIIATFSACSTPQFLPQKASKFGDVPTWSKEAIWYQIFVERFRNGDPSNDPTPKDIAGAYPDFVPEGWKITDWGHDWYKDDDYIQNITEEQKAEHNGFKTFGQKSQLRRYGGDLQGVFDKLDYLEELGVTAIYFNPLNDAPSLHKYDARYWRHIDRNLGPTPEEDLKIIENEDPLDPSTWKMTGADKMFLRLIKELHKRDIKVILDYSWNHTGNTFWAWQDILKNQEKSAYKDWYWINSFDDPETEKDEFDYDGWLNVKSLPELKETQAQNHKKGISAFEGNIASQQAKDLIFNITKRWLDPNNDGNTDDGVDGFRLDVAAEVPLGFWREYREVVKSVNPEAYLIGEVWWEDYPDKLLDPKPFLEGDVFDAVMNYRWYRSARQFFNASPKKLEASKFVQQLESQRENLNPENNYAMMNLVSGHDSPRVLTSLFNKNLYKYQAKPDDNKNYKIHKPDAETYQTLKLLLAQQYTYIGAPHIWAGDEMGMWGADDPSCRKPLIWKDIKFEDEIAHPLKLERPRDKIAFNDDLFAYYKKLIQIRKNHPVLSHGEIEFLVVNDHQDLIAYSRYDDETEVISVFNSSNQVQTIRIPVITSSEKYQDKLSQESYQVKDLYVEVSLLPRTAMILIPQA